MPVPPAEVRAVARDALKRRKQYGRGGTSVGVARARDLANGRNISVDVLRRMLSFFARHEGIEGSAERRRDKTSASSIAYDLWGGLAGKRWATKVLRELADQYGG